MLCRTSFADVAFWANLVTGSDAAELMATIGRFNRHKFGAVKPDLRFMLVDVFTSLAMTRVRLAQSKQGWGDLGQERSDCIPRSAEQDFAFMQIWSGRPVVREAIASSSREMGAPFPDRGTKPDYLATT